jgi:hypothetical protein
MRFARVPIKEKALLFSAAPFDPCLSAEIRGKVLSLFDPIHKRFELA